MEQAFGQLVAIFGWPALVAAIVACCLVWPSMWLERRWGGKGLLPVALAYGYVAGAIASDRAVLPLNPDRAWHWLPFLAIPIAGLGGVIGATWRTQRLAGLLAVVAAAFLGGGALTPDWQLWTRQWPASLAFAGTYLSVLTIVVLLCQAKAGSCRWLAGGMAAAALMTAVSIAALVSFRLAQPAGLAAAVWVSLFAVTALDKSGESSRFDGVIPLYALLVGGPAFSACVEPDPPQVWLLLAPLIPALIYPLRVLAEWGFARPSASSRIS